MPATTQTHPRRVPRRRTGAAGLPPMAGRSLDHIANVRVRPRVRLNVDGVGGSRGQMTFLGATRWVDAHLNFLPVDGKADECLSRPQAPAAPVAISSVRIRAVSRT